jgi:hypothetical protein
MTLLSTFTKLLPQPGVCERSFLHRQILFQAGPNGRADKDRLPLLAIHSNGPAIDTINVVGILMKAIKTEFIYGKQQKQNETGESYRKAKHINECRGFLPE